MHRTLVGLLADTEGRTAVRAHLAQFGRRFPYFYPLHKLRAEGLSPAQAARLHGKSVELEQDFRLAAQLHDFAALPDLKLAELSSYYELKALQDCLLKASGREPAGEWQGGIAKAVNDEAKADELRQASTSSPPCGAHFNSSTFETLTDVVNREVARRVGGSLFPPPSSSR